MLTILSYCFVELVFDKIIKKRKIIIEIEKMDAVE
jgi:hypothetical protein